MKASPTIAAAVLAAGILAAPSSGQADSVSDFYKGKTLTALVGVSAGGEYDFQLRLVARHIGKHIPGRPTVIPQNMTGATGLVMANFLYNVAPQDGTYIGLIQNGLPTSQAVGVDGVKFDASRLQWIGSLAPTSETMVTWKTTGVTTIEEARQKDVIVGAVGSSEITLSFPVMLNDLAGTRFKMVLGYTGSGALDLAMERGEVSGRAGSWSSLKASKPNWVADRQINVLVHSGPKPKDLPDVPGAADFMRNADDRQVLDIVTMGDTLGHPFAAGPGVPAERVAALRKAFVDTLNDPDFRREAGANNLEIDPVSAEALSGAVERALGASEASRLRARKYFQ
jgi:tripartite-type tricarboxylate transporter receptor subunit TctC